MEGGNVVDTGEKTGKREEMVKLRDADGA